MILVEMESLRVDRDWLLHVAVVRVMDKLTEHLVFTDGVIRIWHVAFVTGEESRRSSLKAEIYVGTYDSEDSDSSSSQTSSLEEALLAFVTLDYTAFLAWGNWIWLVSSACAPLMMVMIL